MLSKKYRLPIQSTAARKSLRTFTTKYFIIKVFSSNSPFPRFGAVVSKQVDKRATARNKVRRILLDSMRLSRSTLPSLDFLCITLKPVRDASKDTIDAEIKKALSSFS